MTDAPRAARRRQHITGGKDGKSLPIGRLKKGGNSLAPKAAAQRLRSTLRLSGSLEPVVRDLFIFLFMRGIAGPIHL
jgi:hypothetical protein